MFLTLINTKSKPQKVLWGFLYLRFVTLSGTLGNKKRKNSKKWKKGKDIKPTNINNYHNIKIIRSESCTKMKQLME